MRSTFVLLILGVLLPGLPLLGQDGIYGEKRERHKVWKKWRSNKTAYNPYLHRKGKDKPSAKASRSDKKELHKQKKEARKQMRRSKKTIGRANRKRMKGK